MITKSSTCLSFPWLKSNFSSQSVQRYCLSSTLACSIAVGNTSETEKDVFPDKLQSREDDGLPSYEAVVYERCLYPPDVRRIWPTPWSSGNACETTPVISKRNVRTLAKIPRIEADKNTASLRLKASDTDFLPSYESVICKPSTTKRLPLPPPWSSENTCETTPLVSKRNVKTSANIRRKETDEDTDNLRLEASDTDFLPSYESVISKSRTTQRLALPPSLSSGNACETTPLVSKGNVKTPLRIPRTEADEDTDNLTLQASDTDFFPSYESVICKPSTTERVSPWWSSGNACETTPLVSKRNMKTSSKIPRIETNENVATLMLTESDTDFPPSYDSVICQRSLYSRTTRRVPPTRRMASRRRTKNFSSKRIVHLLPTIPEDENVT